MTGVLILASILVGCATVPENQNATVPVSVRGEWADGASSYGEFDGRSWASDFGDEGLSALLGEALSNSFTLQSALARLEAARGVAIESGVRPLPIGSLAGSGARNLRNNSSGLSITESRSDTFGLNLRLSWELDLWGRVRNEARAGKSDWQAAQEDYRAARLSLAAGVARAYFAALESGLQLELAERSLGAFERNLEVVEGNYARGIATTLEVRLLRANVASAQSVREQRIRIHQSAIRSLELLLGRYPSNELELSGELPILARAVPAGLPSELLERRPDLIASERRLAASLMRKKVAAKSALPSISLTGSGGTSTRDLGEVLNDDFKVWQLAANVTQPLIPIGRVKSGKIRARAAYEQALANHAQTILVAFRDVEESLLAQRSLAVERQAQSLAAVESLAAEEIAWEQYRSGLEDITTVLEAQRRSIGAQRSYLSVANQSLQARIDLYLALGGGFDLED